MTCLFVSVYMYVHMNVCIHADTSVCVYVYQMCMSLLVFLHVNMYVDMYHIMSGCIHTCCIQVDICDTVHTFECMHTESVFM